MRKNSEAVDRMPPVVQTIESEKKCEKGIFGSERGGSASFLGGQRW